MAIRSLNQLAWLRSLLLGTRRTWFHLRYGVRIHRSSTVSTSGRIVMGKRGSLEIGPDTLVAFKTLLLTRDARTGETRPIRIGARSFVGGGAVVLPGVTIGNEAIVAAGAVVMDDVPDRCIVAGNPARVIRRDIEVTKRGRLVSADQRAQRWQDG
jgi:acetyltransferase-like isoleucine patch superfamily enzyme